MAGAFIGASYGSGHQSGSLPASPPHSSRLGSDRPVTQLVPAGGCGQILVANPQGAASSSYQASVLPLSVAAKDLCAPPIGEDALAGERLGHQFGSVEGHVAVTHDLPACPVAMSRPCPSSTVPSTASQVFGSPHSVGPVSPSTAHTGFGSPQSMGYPGPPGVPINPLSQPASPGPLALAGSPMEAILAQYAAAAGQATIPIAVAPNPQYAVPRGTQSPAPSLPPAGAYIGVLGGSTPSLPHVATVPMAASPSKVPSAPGSPTMIGTTSGELGAPSFAISPELVGPAVAPGVQTAGTGVLPQYPPVSLIPQQVAQVTPPAVQLTTLGPASSPVLVSTAFGSILPAATYQVVPQSPAEGPPWGLHTGVQGIPGTGVGPLEPSPTPIADSVLLGHLLGDEAAPPPDQPLPVVAPLPGTSGIPGEEVQPLLEEQGSSNVDDLDMSKSKPDSGQPSGTTTSQAPESLI
eukprot:jgi/Botrbrau1/3417/Bobra.0337s0050.1